MLTDQRQAEIRAELDRILASKRFVNASRMNGLLRYVVEETLAGRRDRIKAFSIAQDVFGRDASFDQQRDPIVRCAAAVVRRARAACLSAASMRGAARGLSLPTAAATRGGARTAPRAQTHNAPRACVWPWRAALMARDRTHAAPASVSCHTSPMPRTQPRRRTRSATPRCKRRAGHGPARLCQHTHRRPAIVWRHQCKTCRAARPGKHGST